MLVLTQYLSALALALSMQSRSLLFGMRTGSRIRPISSLTAPVLPAVEEEDEWRREQHRCSEEEDQSAAGAGGGGRGQSGEAAEGGGEGEEEQRGGTHTFIHL